MESMVEIWQSRQLKGEKAYCYARVGNDGSYVSGFVDKSGAYILTFDK